VSCGLDSLGIDASIEDAIVRACHEVIVHARLVENSLRLLAPQAMGRGMAVGKMIDGNEIE
jgi:hypothetical protein